MDAWLPIATVVLMGVVTFATRAAGYVAIRMARPGPRLERFLEAAPKTMFVALVHGGVVEWLGAAGALLVMALTRNLLASIIAATLVVALVRSF